MNINHLIDSAFMDDQGIVRKYSKDYGIDVCVVGCEYVKILLNLESLEKNRTYNYYKTTSEHRLFNVMESKYKNLRELR